MLQRTARHRVDRGVALLDERLPGWDERVDPDRLDLDSETDCVLVQVYGNFTTGLFRLNLIWDGDGSKYGFSARRDKSVQKQDEEWRRVITARAEERFTESLRQQAGMREQEILAHAARVVDSWKAHIAAHDVELLHPARLGRQSRHELGEGRELLTTVPEQQRREVGDGNLRR